MKKIAFFLSAIFVFLCMAFSAWAVPTTWEVSKNYVPPYYISVMNGQFVVFGFG